MTTNIEQSRRLCDLGLNPSTADMSYSEEYFGNDKDGNDEWGWRLNACKFIDIEGIIPAWSLDALLDALGDSQLVVWRLDKLIMGNGYHLTTDSPVGGKTYIGKTKIEAVYNAVCDMLERRATK